MTIAVVIADDEVEILHSRPYKSKLCSAIEVFIKNKIGSKK